MSNLKGFLIPPRNASDGIANPEPKSLSEELQEETNLVHAHAIQDVIFYSVDSALTGANHDLRTILNVRHNLSWRVISEIVERATPFIQPAIARAFAERDALESQRVKFQELAALFTNIRVQKNGDDPSKYDLIGITEDQVRKYADALEADA